MEKMKAVQVPKARADFEIVEREITQPGAVEHGATHAAVKAVQQAFTDYVDRGGEDGPRNF
jgi:hypothetical protein